MLQKLEAAQKRFEEVTELLAQPDIASDLARVQTLARERAGLEPLVEEFKEYKAITTSLEQTQNMLSGDLDPDMLALVKQEIESLKARQESVLQQLRLALIPKDPNDVRDVIMEIRAGAGGDEAALFAADLFRMYSRYAQSKRWVVEVVDSSVSGIGGFKEVIFEVKGKGAFSRLKYERGVHRVQRVPVTEASGRIHTSTVTVAVLPVAEEMDMAIKPDDLKVEFYHARGAGGQNVNKVATAVRITHLPTGITAQCQDERSQLRNRAKALAVLRARVLDRLQGQQHEAVDKERRSQIGSAERAEKIRTYNFPQNRVTDHRTGLTIYNLTAVLDGDLDELVEASAAHERTQRLTEMLV